MKQLVLLLAVFMCQVHVFAQENKVIKLPEPQLDKGMLLMQALKQRQSIRTYSDREISLQEMANLLWAANGINRKESGRRTVPTAQNKQEIEVYMSNKEGLFRYDAQEHALVTIHNRDIRVLTGTQAYVATAPVNMIIVADLDKMGGDRQSNLQTANIDAGFVSQNIYLYCASENMATVVRGSVDREMLTPEMGLGPNLYIVVAQTVGYPAE
ncbi:MAG TPA: SagB/ThcOx family dehydrogenase [Bacteroidales bacterium]|nr:SagB/ThcOx family dehydrogenase [Bacteroidales bacterium]